MSCIGQADKLVPSTELMELHLSVDQIAVLVRSRGWFMNRKRLVISQN
jgi:hypothetical protein